MRGLLCSGLLTRLVCSFPSHASSVVVSFDRCHTRQLKEAEKGMQQAQAALAADLQGWAAVSSRHGLSPAS